MSNKLRFKKVGISNKVLSNLCKVSKDKDYVQTDSLEPGVDFNYVIRSKNPKQLMKFMNKFGIRSLVTLKIKPGYYTFKAKSLLNKDIEVDVEIKDSIPFRYHMLEGLELLQNILNNEGFKKDSIDELSEKIQRVKNIVNSGEMDGEVEIPDELLEQISILEDVINKSE